MAMRAAIIKLEIIDRAIKTTAGRAISIAMVVRVRIPPGWIHFGSSRPKIQSL